ncbi:helicase-exonuclease AddAB subunit AddA [Paenibacillus hubeiensis]|uniref:helicase-exonuclease AddAB subunit AddA n=1 Tax=Paenibacillus hubeiensis TaxID=3077330 RepID=UPI0031BB7A9C
MTKLHSIPKPEGSFWSDDQWSAISQSGEDILVAAAAGSGKTAVLVERIIRKIADPSLGFSVDRLLVATFTKAAASEMKQRIREALEQALEQNPEEEHLRTQLSLLGRASITTLHSFCMEVIRRYYQLIPLNPAFRILNENEAELMRQELLEQLFEEKYGQEGEGSTFRELVDWFSGERSDDAMHRLVQRLYDFSRSHSWPEHWLAQMADAFQVESVEALGQSPWVRSILQDAALTLSGAAGLLRQGIAIALQPGGPAPYADTLKADLAMVEELLSAVQVVPWERQPEAFQTVAFGKLKPCKKDQTDPDLQEQVKELREAAKKAVSDLKASLFGRSAFSFWQELQQAAPLMQELSRLVSEFAELYRSAKQERGQVDFNDLEHYCLQILRHEDSTPDQALPSDAAMEYRERFDEVLLDEYQDTNTVQEDIVRLISREAPGNRFMVGDVKQSIYRFRLAEPGLFLSKYRQYRTDAGDREDQALPLRAGKRIDLARNFRSRSEVVHAVNMLFRQIMNESVAEIAYDERAQLAYGATFPEESLGTASYTPELLLIDRQGDGADWADAESETGEGQPLAELESAELETAQLEARAIAGRIRELLGDGDKPALQVYDKALKTMRPTRYGDIVILLRSAAMWAPLMIEEFRQQGIPAGGEQSKGYFQATEVEVMLSLLQIVDNPRQDIPLASVLRSPIVGLDEEELALIRLGDQRQSFYDAVIMAAGSLEEPSIRLADSMGKGKDDATQVEWSEAWSELEQALGETATTAELELPEPVLENDDPDQSFVGAEGHADGQFYAGLSNGHQEHFVQHESDEADLLRQKLVRFLRQLQQWRREARQGSLSELIWRIYRETGYLDWVRGLPGGMQRQSNLKALYDRARQYEEATANRGLFRFLTYVSRLRENGGDLGAMSASGEQDNAVRIMTIHRSKGLEFPVVFVAGISKMFNQQDLNAPFLMHKELGFGPRFVDRDNRVTYPTLANLAIRRRARFELLAEEMRVLYVALTRPKEKMILVGTVKDAAKKAAAWAQVKDSPELNLPDYLLAAGRSYLDWIGPSLVRHPDATLLRQLAGGSDAYAACLTDDESRWNIAVVNADRISKEVMVGSAQENQEGLSLIREERMSALAAKQPVSLRPKLRMDDRIETEEALELPEQRTDDRDGLVQIDDQASSNLMQEVDRRLSWSYAHEAATQVAASTSVSELKSRFFSLGDESLQVMEELFVRNRYKPDGEAGQVDTENPGSGDETAEAGDGKPVHARQGAGQAPDLRDGRKSDEIRRNVPVRNADNGGGHAADASFKLHLRRPKFMEEKQLTGAERGTVYHTVMQHVPFDGTVIDVAVLEQTVANLVQRQLLTQQQADVVEAAELMAFFETEPGSELLRADRVQREIPFVYGLPANLTPARWVNDRTANAGEGTVDFDAKQSAVLEQETVLVQGIIDCLYEVDGELVLLDYKTDRVLEHRGGVDALVANYSFQLNLYAQAIEDILGRKVSRKWLYFFDGGYAVRL